MNVDHHDLHHEFPEYVKTIDTLKQASTLFAHRFGEYNALTSRIEELELKDLPIADTALEDMKKLRLKLKDELDAMLRAHKA